MGAAYALSGGQLPVGALAASGIIALEGLVDSRREAQKIIHRIVDSRAARLFDTLHALFCEPQIGREG